MTEDKKNIIGGIPGIYWRYIAALVISSVVLVGWNILFTIPTPAQYSINYSQFMEQLNAGNIKAVSIKKLLVTGGTGKGCEPADSGSAETSSREILQTVLPSFQGEGSCPNCGKRMS